MKLGLTEDDMRSTQRSYTSNNRETWKKIGFRSASAQVHDDDRELILAELEVRKHQRMLTLAENPKTTDSALHVIAQRNTTASPSAAQRAELQGAAANSVVRAEVLHFLKQCSHYVRKYTNVHNNYDHEATYSVRVRMEARAVSYMNLASAYYRLGVARVAHAEALSVFGLNTPPVGDNDNV